MGVPVDFLIGCTGSGKGAVGRAVAERVGAEIISVDSMKVYRGMDIGTAKPTREERARVPHHLIDVAEPWESFSVARYVEAADAAIRDITARGRRVLVVGGTCLHIKALSEGLFEGPGADPQIRAEIRRRAGSEGAAALHRELARVDPRAAERIHPNDLRRIERALEVFRLTGRPISELQQQWDAPQRRYDCRFVGLRREKADQNHRINLRVQRMIERGLVDEVRSLLSDPRGLSDVAAQAVGYAEIIAHLRGEGSLEDAVERIKINTRRLAKSQRTWFRRWRDVAWLDVAEAEPVEAIVERVL
ncbi:MAG TPA: tRNA (adenosine(37)-N6)-dimethylallyltransferase MiaA, partial [Phycisphaerae bacterium]|nr:tRNA (adenosine(37)-N6)-dimethylallyltransferase MiaA [Phycisphaerae bacterium]